MELYAAFADFLLDGKARALSPKTLRAYNYNLERFVAYLEQAGVQTLDDLRPTHIRGFLADLQDRALSPYTVDQFYRSIKVFLRWCVSQDYLQKNPMRGISRPQRPKRFVPRLSMEQVQELLHILSEGEYFPERNLAMVALLVDSGLRSSELLNLNVTDVQAGLLRVVGKGNKERWVSLSEYTQRAVEDYLRVRGDHPDCPALFVSRRGTRLGTQGIRLILCKLRGQLGLPFCLTRNVTETNSQEAMVIKRNTLQDLLEQIRPRYARSTKKEKKHILDEFVATTGYHRKYAVRLLRHGLPEKRRQRRRKSLYPATLDAILVRLAEVLGWPAARYLQDFLPTFLTVMEEHQELRVTKEQRRLLLQMSAATMDRRLQPFRQQALPRARRVPTCLGQLYAVLRLWVNFFKPVIRLQRKEVVIMPYRLLARASSLL